jgi:membrane-associated phospholipid phosphatase
MWAAVTPYAEEYDMPWLYGVAALTNAARVASREHWVSDTVGSSLIGYALGHIAWQARRDSRRGKSGPQLSVGPGSVAVSWDFK